jgi:midasin (ATPase involved in ribosome maturation)
MPKIVDRSIFVNAAREMFGKDTDVLSREQVLAVCEEHSINYPTWLTNDPANRAGRGMYRLPVPSKKVAKSAPAVLPSAVEHSAATVDMALAVVPLHSNTQQISLIPEKANGYVPFGHFSDVRSIIKSGKFYPVYITGLSGNGKTMMVEQVCVAEKRECVRVNITIETDEDDLIGGFRLIDGKTVWHNGPVIQAMERGAILLLDEIDLGSNKLMCLQPVLEGKPVYLKKINKLISPVAGFNIIATANTKGKGSDDGRFIGTNVMNEAFLERFSITLEQEYPNNKTETKILTNVLSNSNIEDAEFVKKLVSWADVIRKSFAEGAVSDIISTRRLVHICEAYAIFNRDREKAVQLCLNRFDIDTKNSFLDLYKKLDETINPITPDKSTDEVPF